MLSHLRLSFNDDETLSNVSIFSGGEEKNLDKYSHLKIDQAIGKLKLKKAINNIPYSMELNPKGISYLGGVPDDFKVPSPKEFSKFQYFGFISRNEECFPDLDFDINLTFPLFCSAGHLFLDYSNFLEPKIWNMDEFWTEEVYDELDKDFEIRYQKKFISFEKLTGSILSEDIGRAGYYMCDIGYCYPRPISPLTKKPMHFLCQIEGGSSIPTEYTSVSKDYKLYNYGFKHLQFYSGNGEITIFYENETRLVLYLIGGS